MVNKKINRHLKYILDLKYCENLYLIVEIKISREMCFIFSNPRELWTYNLHLAFTAKQDGRENITHVLSTILFSQRIIFAHRATQNVHRI